MDRLDLLVVGAGPAGLAAAIRAKRAAATTGRDLAVAVIDKAGAPGAHVLSGATFEPACLDELLPGWTEIHHPFTEAMVRVERDELYFLSAGSAYRVPSQAVPSRMRHVGDFVISATRLAQFLAEQAVKAGVEVYHGYAARTLIVDDGVVHGVRLAELGLARDGSPKRNHLAAQEIRAPITILADGSRGVLSTEFGERFGGGINPQVY